MLPAPPKHRTAAGNVKEPGSPPFTIQVSSRVQVRTSAIPSHPAICPPLSALRKQQRQCGRFPFVCTSCLRGAGCRGADSSWSSPPHVWLHCIFLLPAHSQHIFLANPMLVQCVSRACCTLAIPSIRRSPLRKNPQVSPSEAASPVQRRRAEELHFFFNLSLKV